MQPAASASLGADLRALRKARGITLKTLASKLDRSVGWLSQVERNLSAPNIDDLHRFADTYEVPLSLFFGRSETEPEERGRIVRAAARRSIGAADGLTESLLSPDLTDDFEVIHCVFAPGARITRANARPTQEVATIISGSLRVWIEDAVYDLGSGDSFRLRGEQYRWHNRGREPAVAIWVISPPVY